MKILLALNGLFEGVFGIVAIAAPQLPWAGGDAMALANGRAFGFAALAVAVLSFLAFRRAGDQAIAMLALVTLLVWHAGLTVAEVLAAMQNLAPPPVAVIHGLFTLAFAFFLVRQLRAKPSAPAA